MRSKENNQPTCETYRVEFHQPTFDLPRTPMVIADNIPEMEVAVGFALQLHRNSNTTHDIYVKHGDDIDVTFIRK